MIRILYLVIALLLPAQALAVWYDTNADGTAPDWNYRVPIIIPSGTPAASTISIDIDFGPLMTTVGATGSLQESSLRVAKDSGALIGFQEYSDRRYGGVIDNANNNRGEVRFILEDNGPVTYYLYFDTTSNGSKPANPQPTINGNFENSVGSTPTNWVISAINANGAQNNETYTTNYNTTYNNNSTNCSDGSINNLDASPNNTGSSASRTGRVWHLMGYRNNCEDGAMGQSESIQLTKTFAVPATNPGNLTFYFQLQAFDDARYDFFQLLTKRSSDALFSSVDHTTLAIANPGNLLRIRTAGIGKRNSFGSTLIDAGWQKATLSLIPYAGSTLSIRFSTNFFTDNVYRSWIKLDDIEWSIATATLGTPQIKPTGTPLISLQKQSATLSDPVNGNSNPKAIPGAVIGYTINATNSGNGAADNDTISIIDQVPANTALFVNNMVPGSGPVTFTDGATLSGLSYTFTSLASTTDDVSFSNDGGVSYNYTPTPDADGSDSLVTHIQILPKGQFAAASGSGNPSFTLKFRVIVQ